MRINFTFFPALLFSSVALAAQPSAPAAPVTIYASGADVTSPQLLPSTAARSYTAVNCRADEDGTATFSLIIDSTGQPRNVYFLAPIGDDLDLIALREVLTDRFTPGQRAGQPAAVAASLDVKLHACLAERKNAQGKTQNILELTSAPVQELKPPLNPPQQAILVSGSGVSTNAADPESGIEKLGGDVTAPIPFPPTPSAMQSAFTLLRGGQYKVSIVVNRYGLPERLKIVDAEMPGREAEVAAIFRLYRWKPAMKDGVPVPVRIETSTKGMMASGGTGRRR